MRGPGFLRFNERKKTQSTNPLTLALTPRGDRGQSQKLAESQVAATDSEFRAFAVRIHLLHKRFALLIAQEQLSYAGLKQNDFVFQSLFDQRILQGYELCERVA